jgi:diguanylate cyclase (GGDEF)-like protein
MSLRGTVALLEPPAGGSVMGRCGSGRSRKRNGVPADDAPAMDAERSASLADQRVADADQSASDADQTGSDADQSAAEEDAAGARDDQQAADEDQARAEHQWAVGSDDAAESAEASRAARATGKAHRKHAREIRAESARERAARAEHRDATAAARDETARRRDARAAAIDRAIADSDATMTAKLEELQAHAAAERARAAADRERAARDRADAMRERARLEEELQKAHLDELTGAFGREMGRMQLTNAIDRARRGDGRFVVAFVDVDGMKGINDHDGHAAGDHVLQTVVSAMRSNMRSFDPIVRYGGDEFVCGLGGADLETVERRFDTIGASVQELIGVGISVGLASLGEDETLDQLTARADAILLDVKKRYAH